MTKFNSLVRPHRHILNLMKVFGYEPDDRGVCYGVATTAMLSLVAGKADVFREDMAIMSHLFPELSLKTRRAKLTELDIVSAKMKIAQLERQAIAHANAKKNPQDPQWINDQAVREKEKIVNDFINVKALLENIKVNFNPTVEGVQHYLPENTEFHGQASHINESAALLYGEPDQSDTAIEEISVHCRSYTPDEMFNSIDKMIEASHQLNENDAPVGFVFSAGDHTISVGYDPKTKSWLLVDAGQLPVKTVDFTDSQYFGGNVAYIKKFIWDGLTVMNDNPRDDKNPLVMNTQVITTNAAKSKLEEKLGEWIEYQNNEYYNDSEKLQSNSSKTKSELLYIFCLTGNEKNLDVILRHMSASELNQSVEEAFHLDVAIGSNHPGIVQKLIDAGASVFADEDILSDAIECDNPKITDLIVSHGLSEAINGNNDEQIQTILNALGKLKGVEMDLTNESPIRIAGLLANAGYMETAHTLVKNEELIREKQGQLAEKENHPSQDSVSNPLLYQGKYRQLAQATPKNEPTQPQTPLQKALVEKILDRKAKANPSGGTNHKL